MLKLIGSISILLLLTHQSFGQNEENIIKKNETNDINNDNLNVQNRINSQNDIKNVNDSEFSKLQEAVFGPEAIYIQSDALPTNGKCNDDQFEWNFIKEIFLKNPNKNVIVSPLAVKLMLSLLLEGAGDNSATKYELLTALRTANNHTEKISSFWKQTIKSLKEPNNYYDLLFSTRVFADQFIQPTDKYAGILHSFYDTDISRLSFKNASESAKIINDWSEKATKGYIKNIVSDEQIKTSVMLILNAMYFKGKWQYSFDPNESHVADFFYEPTKAIKVQYMTKRDYYNYTDSFKLHAKIIQIPYEGNRFCLTLLLPKAKGGLEQLIYDMSSSIYRKLEWSADDQTEVKLTMPKLSFAFESSLKSILQTLGVKSLFTDEASLPLIDRGIHLDQNLKVSDIYQKSGIQIDEVGTIAYAETVAAIENKFGGGIEDFNANRPFLFLINDMKEDKILFAGQIVNPIG